MIKKRGYLVHRLIASAFLDNSKKMPQVNHKDENRLNNSASNLEWCTAKYNNNYGTKLYKCSLINKNKKVSQKTKNKISEKMKLISMSRKRNDLGQFI